MNRVGAAPCQCSSAGSKKTRSPGRTHLDRAAAALAQADALEHPDRLAVRMRVPGSARAGCEVDAARVHTRTVGRCGDRIDVDRAGEPVLRTRGGAEAVPRDLHERSPRLVSRLVSFACLSVSRLVPR